MLVNTGSLSAAAVSRALECPKLHLERLAESIAAPARYPPLDELACSLIFLGYKTQTSDRGELLGADKQGGW